MDSAPDRVTVVVKASNQQFDDQTVFCEPSWSVRKLKEHLQEVYPCKPRIDEQKLIYAGQLLTDKLILKDILRTYEGVHPPNHAMHLVYTPKTRQQLTGSASSAKDKSSPVLGEGLRHRNIQGAASSEAASQSVHSTIPQVTTGSVAGNCPNSLSPGGNNVPGLNFSQATNEYLVAQQIAMQSWMQQAYIQYMNQYMNLISIGVRPESVYMQNQPNDASANSNLGIPQMPYLPHTIPFANINSANVPSSSIPPNQVPAANPESEDTTPQAVPVPPVAEQAAQQPQNEIPQPRFPNIVQEDLPENRDWLDMFYSFSRLLVLLTLVYFYSSPLRCLVVLFIGLAIYFYHVGFFRNAVEANNNNRGHEENPQQQAAQQEIPNPPQPGNNQNAAGENQQPATEQPETAEVDGAPVTTNPVVESQNNGTSVIAFIRTFVVSFFVSLLPETPAL